MIGAIAGDIIGSRFEGQRPPAAGFELFHRDCRFTDDSVCSLAVAEAIMQKADFAAMLRAFVRRHPDAGYGAMFLNWALSDDAPAYGSWGNGAPMRTAAAGWLAASEAEADRLAAAQASVSHNHPDAIRGAQAVARCILALRQGVPARDLRLSIERDFGYELRAEAAGTSGGFDVSAAGTVPPAIASALDAGDWESAVRAAVGLGGDTDTLGCIAGAVAEAHHGVPANIAERARGYLSDDLLQVLDRFERRRQDG